jgi:3-oxoacyl-[acyl-carrier-protein] synthase II
LKRRVVVTGLGIITAHGTGKELNWSKTASGISSIGEITSFEASKYRGKFGGEAKDFRGALIRNTNGKRLDRASHLSIHSAREALSDAAIIDDLKDINILLSIGTTLGGMISGEIFNRNVIGKGFDRANLSLVSDYYAHCQAINLFKELNLKGEFWVFSSACASGANAIGYAFNSIRNGSYDVAICGGYDTLSEFALAGFNSLLAVAPSICRPFDKQRDGLVLGEGAGVLILEELEHALNRESRIYGEITGYGESSDAYHITSPEPSGRAASVAIKKAWSDAGRPVVDYINAHGTGTKYNDIMETNAMVLAFGPIARKIPVSSIKSMIGHLLGGAGAVEAVISLLSINNKILPPNINYETLDPECDLNIITKAEKHNIKTVLSNSFGFGGLNAAIMFREYL